MFISFYRADIKPRMSTLWEDLESMPFVNYYRDEASNITFFSEHYIGYIPLEMYQNAAASRGVAGRVLVEQHI